jgi:hypothetical protein
LRPYTPDALEQAKNWLSANWYGDDRAGQAKADRLVNTLSYTPAVVAQAPFHAKDVITRLGEGDMPAARDAALQTLLSAVPGAAKPIAEAMPELRTLGNALMMDERGTFGGKLADTYPHHMEPLANDMWAKGAPVKDIFDQTGLFPVIQNRQLESFGLPRDQQPKPAWQFEISDEGAKIKKPIPQNYSVVQSTISGDKKDVLMPNSAPKTLGDYIEHDALFKAYPELKDIPLTYKLGPGGAFNPGRNWNTYNPMTLGTASGLPTAIHEVGHTVQNVEGFAGGAAPTSLRPSAQKLFTEKMNAVTESMPYEVYAEEKFHKPFGQLSDLEKQRASTAWQMHENLAAGYRQTGVPKSVVEGMRLAVGELGYTRSAGEAEANNAMDRLALQRRLANLEPDNPEYAKIQALLKYPWLTERVAPQLQMVDNELFRGRRPPEEVFTDNTGTGDIGPAGPGPSQEQRLSTGEAPFGSLWHGSPHDFDAVDLGKIGTGEGGAAFGKGFYTAQERKVAEEYKRTLSPANTTMTINGRAQTGHFEDLLDQMDFDNSLEKHFANKILSHMQDNKEDFHTAVDRARYSVSGNNAMIDFNKAIDKLHAAAPKVESKGKLYEFGLHADPKSFINYDAPLGSQEHLLPALNKAGLDLPPRLSNLDYLRDMAKNAPPASREWAQSQLEYITSVASREGRWLAPRETSDMQRLADAGVPGLRYLDQGSRVEVGKGDQPLDTATRVYDAAGEDVGRAIKELKYRIESTKNLDPKYHVPGDHLEQAIHLLETRQPFDQRTRNFVIFNPDVLSLIKKYGLTGLLVGGTSGNALMQKEPK